MVGLSESIYNDGRNDMAKEVIYSMFENSIPIKQIAKIMDISEEMVEEIIETQKVVK